MRQRPICRLLVALVVVLAVAVPAFGAPPQAPAGGGGRRAPAGAAWQELVGWVKAGWVGGMGLLGFRGLEGGIQRKWGCRIDPNGLCVPDPAPAPAVDWGCRVDPDGACVSSSTPAPTVDWGCGMDPNGLCNH